MKKKRKPRLKPHHELVSSKRWVVVWQGETPEDKARTRTTWQIPVGKVWDDLRQKLRDGVWPERNGLTTLDYKECMALRDLVNQYECLLSTPNWRRKEIAKALDEAIGQGEASEPREVSDRRRGLRLRMYGGAMTGLYRLSDGSLGNTTQKIDELIRERDEARDALCLIEKANGYESDWKSVVKMQRAIRERDEARAEVERLRERLQFDPGGSDKIDELEDAVKYLRNDVEKAAREITKLRNALAAISLDEYESTSSASEKVHGHARIARKALHGDKP